MVWGSCVCNYDPKTGYWIGEYCNKCAYGYGGCNCNILGGPPCIEGYY